ncbi:hypothetical protein J6590_006736 [Homalodisca vitripennis]|nr:hypothetical protein J6590_006736 [Homalodisca vitripennis]
MNIIVDSCYTRPNTNSSLSSRRVMSMREFHPQSTTHPMITIASHDAAAQCRAARVRRVDSCYTRPNTTSSLSSRRFMSMREFHPQSTTYPKITIASHDAAAQCRAARARRK